MKKQNVGSIRVCSRGVSRTLWVVGGMTNFANFDLDRRPITKQFGPLKGYRKENRGIWICEDDVF